MAREADERADGLTDDFSKGSTKSANLTEEKRSSCAQKYKHHSSTFFSVAVNCPLCTENAQITRKVKVDHFASTALTKPSMDQQQSVVKISTRGRYLKWLNDFDTFYD